MLMLEKSNELELLVGVLSNIRCGLLGGLPAAAEKSPQHRSKKASEQNKASEQKKTSQQKKASDQKKHQSKKSIGAKLGIGAK